MPYAVIRYPSYASGFTNYLAGKQLPKRYKYQIDAEDAATRLERKDTGKYNYQVVRVV